MIYLSALRVPVSGLSQVTRIAPSEYSAMTFSGGLSNGNDEAAAGPATNTGPTANSKIADRKQTLLIFTPKKNSKPGL